MLLSSQQSRSESSLPSSNKWWVASSGWQHSDQVNQIGPRASVWIAIVYIIISIYLRPKDDINFTVARTVQFRRLSPGRGSVDLGTALRARIPCPSCLSQRFSPGTHNYPSTVGFCTVILSYSHQFIIVIIIIIIIIIITFNMHPSFSLSPQTQNLLFFINRTFSDWSHGFLGPFPDLISSSICCFVLFCFASLYFCLIHLTQLLIKSVFKLHVKSQTFSFPLISFPRYLRHYIVKHVTARS